MASTQRRKLNTSIKLRFTNRDNAAVVRETAITSSRQSKPCAPRPTVYQWTILPTFAAFGCNHFH
jgi:hypothetical protein